MTYRNQCITLTTSVRESGELFMHAVDQKEVR
jgi:hypothetical protein